MHKSALQYMVAEITEALDYLHSLGVSHRDLKPENIFVNEDGRLKLGDLGSAGVSKTARELLKIRNYKHKDGVKEDDKLNTFVGTKEYVSPEVLKGRSCSPAADMWSLGVIIYQLYTGVTPFFVADSEYYTFQNIMECKYQIPHSVPEDAKDLIEKLLIFDPKERLSAKQVMNHEFFADFEIENIDKIDSPLCSLYNLIDEDCVDLESDESDSFVDGSNFDEDFKESLGNSKPILQQNRNFSKFKTTNSSYSAFLKKSSSLGERDLDYLKVIDEESEEMKKDEEYEPEPMVKAKSQINDISKDGISQDNTYDSGNDAHTPKARDLSPNFDDKSSEGSKNRSKTVVLEGHIKKITAWIIYKRRYMELSYTDNVPRLVYYTANKKDLRNEISLTKHTKVYSTGPTKFEIADLTHTYYFKDCGDEVKVKQWVAALSKAIANLSFRKMSFRGNKAMSQTFA